MLYQSLQVRGFLSILFFVLSSLFVSQTSFAKSNPERWGFDLQKPQDQLEAYVKVAGSLDKREVYIQYYGEIMAILPGYVH